MTRRRFSRPTREAPTPDLVDEAVARTKEGDIEALHFLYVRFADDVTAVVDGIVAGAEAAEAVTEKVFAELVRELRRYQPG
jgi:hypothetical protein